MAKDYKREDILYPDQKIIQSELVHEMQTSYIEYAMSVIVGRALPDVRDGLKPVHRRILYAMYEDNLTSDKPFKKSATCVGDVLGRYHPHGDASVYDAMVRLAQDFSMRYMLVDGHGNFGSVDGDPPAAYRYTEARLSKIANEMLRDIDKDTVDWDPNFDETRREPRVLPCRFPNLLVNGSSGIAVGMATNIPPHNLTEVINACVCVLENPDATLSDLMQHVTGPDFPTRGIIVGRSGIRAAYATGRGRIVVRARTETETWGHDRIRIIVTELPYQVNKRQLIQNISEQVRDKKLDGISGLRDESDRNGMRIVIELKKDANTQVVLNRLFAQTQMQTTFAVNMLALVDNQSQPKILSLRHILDEYLTFQEEIITRRTRYDLKKAQDRAHILEGLARAIDIVDEIIATIRGCKGGQAEAKQELMAKYDFDEPQAAAIVAFRLGQLAGLEIEKIRNELGELHIKIADYQDILSSETRVLEIVKEEARAIGDKFGDERRTEITAASGDVDDEDLIPVEDCMLTLTTMGYMKRQTVDTYKAQNRGGKGIMGMSRREEDVAKTMFTCSTHDYIMLFTNKGKVFKMKGYEIPAASRTSKGMNVVNLLPLENEEQISAMVRVPDSEERQYLCMVTKNGVIKRTEISQYDHIRKTGIIAINLDEGDELSWVEITDGNRNLIVATHDGMSICFKESDARLIGRTARGVRAIQLAEGDYVVGFAVALEDTRLLTVSETGYGRKSNFDDYRVQSRAGKGLINYHTDTYGKVAMIAPVREDQDIIMISQEGIVIRTPVDQISAFKRPAKGVRVMRTTDEDKVVTLSVVEHMEPEKTDDAPEGDGTETPASAPETAE